jgi:hypothetical protein
MTESSLAGFIEAINADDALRQRVIDAERVAARRIYLGAEAFIGIAADAGFDISGWNLRPDEVTPTPTAHERETRRHPIEPADTCCYVFTSTY